jgi:hypothetical protein
MLLARNARGLPQPQTLGEIVENRCSKKNPSDATNKGRIASPNTVTNTGSRKHAVLLRSLLFRLPVAAEGRLKGYFANSSPKIAIG